MQQAIDRFPSVSPIERNLVPVQKEVVLCDCDCIARMTVNGKPRCYTCAEEIDGVDVFLEYRRYGV